MTMEQILPGTQIFIQFTVKYIALHVLQYQKIII